MSRRTIRYPAIEEMADVPQAQPVEWHYVGQRFKRFIFDPQHRVMFVNGRGNRHFAAFHDGEGEELITLGGIVLGGMLQGEDVPEYLASIEDFFHPEHRLFLNRPPWAPQSDLTEYWYLMFVNALVAGIIRHQASEAPGLVPMLRASMDRIVWLAHQIGYDFNDQGFDFRANAPFTRREEFRQPDSVGGYAYLMVLAYDMFGDDHYLSESRIAMERYLAFPNNPWYEMPNGAMACHAAARLNELGSSYDVERAVFYVFDHVKGPLHVGTWGDKEVSGLMRGWFGNLDETERKIAYSLETLVLLPYLLPVLKTEPALAGVVGKYALHAASNARWFLADCMPEASQSTPHLAPDVPYENLIHRSEGISPYASGDFHGHRSVYGGALLMWWDAMIRQTDDPYVPAWDLDATDFLDSREGGTEHRHWLLYNPHAVERVITLALPDARAYRGQDRIRERVLFVNARNSARLTIPARTAVVLRLTPGD